MSGPPESEFGGKRALVTGGTKGIGEAIVRRLRSSGASVVTTARSAPPELPTPDLFVGADISTAEGTEKVVRYVLDRLGGIEFRFGANTGERMARNQLEICVGHGARPSAFGFDGCHDFFFFHSLSGR